MDLPPSGRRCELLTIETDDFELSIKGPVKSKVVEAFSLHQDEQGEPLRARLVVSAADAIVQVYHPEKRLVSYSGGPVFPCFFEQTNYELVLDKKDRCPRKLSIDHLNKNLREAITPVGKSDRVQSGILNFQDEVGYSRFDILGDGEKLVSFEIEVYPSKLDYQRDYLLLLQEVNEEVYNLAYDFLMRTSLYASLRNEKQPTQAEFFAIFQAIRVKLFQALERLKKRPHHKIIPVNRVVEPARVKRAGRKAASWLEKRSHLFEMEEDGLVSINGAMYTPRKALDTKKELTYDTYENRFLKWLLRQLDVKLNAFSERYVKASQNQDQRVLEEITKVRKHLQRYIRHGFLQEVGELKQVEHSSLVMQMAPGYRDVYRSYLMLLKGLHISSDVFSISLKGLAELYEYWCFLKINSLLRKKYRLERNDLIAVDRKGITVCLKKGNESRIRYLNPRNGEKFTVTYNQTFKTLPTITQKPDNVLKLEKEGSKTQYQYIFDAKYRICVDEDYVSKFDQAGPPEDTINAMHRYRDAIVMDSQNDLRRDIFGAFVLFPHNDELAYAGKKGGKPAKFYESLGQVGIGALPFLPGQTALVESMLDELLLESPESAFERTILQEGTTEYLVKDSKRNVLIGPLGRREQFGVCKEHNMYYTYLKYVQPSLNELEYVAIYQSKTKFRDEEEQGIHYYGRINDFRILRRDELREAPGGRNPNELVVRFNVNSWEKRLEPIKPGGYGPAEPQRTSWEIFKEAHVYPELHLSGLEVRLWRELRRFKECTGVEFPAEQIREADHMTSMEFPGLVIKKINENEFYVVAGRQSKVFSFKELNVRPGKILRDVISFWSENGVFVNTKQI